MNRLFAIGILLLLGVGCAADGREGSWDEVMKDLRGDNREMTLGSSGIQGTLDRPSR